MKVKQSLPALVSILVSIAIASAASAAEPPTHLAMAQAAIETYIIPHLDALRSAAEPLPAAVENVCKSGSPEARKALEKTFANVVVAYAGVDFLRFGPMQENGRREQISFWPDPRGFVARQLRLILLNKDEKIAAPGMLAKQSAAVQGLPALEDLMQDKDVPLGPTEPARFRCLLAHAIAANIVRLTNEVADGWEKPGGWKDKMLHPGPDNDTYKSGSKFGGRGCEGFACRIFAHRRPAIEASSRSEDQADAALCEIRSSESLLCGERRRAAPAL